MFVCLWFCLAANNSAAMVSVGNMKAAQVNNHNQYNLSLALLLCVLRRRSCSIVVFSSLFLSCTRLCCWFVFFFTSSSFPFFFYFSCCFFLQFRFFFCCFLWCRYHFHCCFTSRLSWEFLCSSKYHLCSHQCDDFTDVIFVWQQVQCGFNKKGNTCTDILIHSHTYVCIYV